MSRGGGWRASTHPKSAALLLACAALALAGGAFGQAAFAELRVEQAHYWISDGALEVRLDGPVSWVDAGGVQLIGSDGRSATADSIFYDDDLIVISLGDARGDFEGLQHPRYVVAQAGSINGTDGTSNSNQIRAAISYDDMMPPGLSLAEYDSGTGILEASFSEPLSRVDALSILVYGADGARLEVGALEHHSGDDAMRVDLGGSDAAPSKMSVSAGGVEDIWGNANAADLSVTVSVSEPPDNPATPPLNSTGTVTPPLNSTVTPPLNSTVTPPLNSTVTPPLNSTVTPPLNSTVTPPLNSTVTPPLNSTVTPPLNSTVTPPLNSTVTPPLNSTVTPPLNSTVTPPLNSTVTPPLNSTVTPPLNSTVTPPLNSTVTPPLNSTVTPPLNSTVTPPLNSTVTPPLNSTVTPPLNSTVTPPLNSTVTPPLNSTVTPPTRIGHPDTMWATYNTNMGRLDVAMGNIAGGITGLNASKFELTGADGTDICQGNCTVALTGNATLTVTPINATGFERMTGPRYLTVGVGGLSDNLGFNTLPIKQLVSYSDTVAPAVISAVYNVTSGTVNVSLSERTLAVSAQSVVLRDSLGNTIHLRTISHESYTNTLSITLSDSNKTAFADFTPPRQMSISAGGITDPWGNSNTNATSHVVSYVGDNTSPTILSATYNSGGTLNVTFTERVLPVDPTQFTLYAASKPFSISKDNLYQTTHSASLNITIPEDQRTAFEINPAITISPGGLKDIWGNVNRQTINYTTINVDTIWAGVAMGAERLTNVTATGQAGAANTKPTVVVVRLHPNEAIYQLKITFSEAVSGGSVLTSKILDGTALKLSIYSDSCGYWSPSAVVHQCSISPHHLSQIPNYANPILELPGGKITNGKYQGGHPIYLDAVKKPIIIYESVKPTFSSAKYFEHNGTVSITFSEKLFAADGSKIHIHDTGNNNNKVSLSGATYTNDTVTLTLGASDISKVNGYATPQLDIDAGAVTDMSGNLIDGVTNQAITEYKRPTITNTAYYSGNGNLTITFSKNLDLTTRDATKMQIRNTGQSTGGVTLSNSIITNNGTNFIDFNLTDADIRTVNSLASPNLIVGADAVTDNHGIGIAAATVALNVIDTTKPEFVSAKYHYHEQVLNITFNKPLSGVDPSKLSISGPKSTFCSFTLGTATYDDKVVTSNIVNVSHAKMLHCDFDVRLAIAAGAVNDTYNIGIESISNSTVNIIDNIKPTLIRVEYRIGLDEIDAVFSEFVGQSTVVYVRDIDQDTGGVIMQQGNVIQNTIRYSSFDATTIKSYQVAQMDIEAGGVEDINGNGILRTLNHNLTFRDVTLPTFTSATYFTGNSTIKIVFSETISSADATKIHIRNTGQSVEGITLSSFTISNDTLSGTLSPTQRTTFDGMTTPQLDIDAGAVQDSSNNEILKTHNQAITIQDTTKPTYASSTYLTGNGTIKIVFSETISSAVASKIHIRDTGQSTGGITLSSVTVTVNTLKATLSSAQQTTLNAMTTPQLDIDAGAVQDSSNNAIVAATDKSITIQDTTKPTYASSTYLTGNGTIKIVFSETISSAVASKIHIRDTGQSTGGITLSSVTVTVNTLKATLSSAQQTTLNAMTTPQLDIDAGAVQDSSNNAIVAATDKSITIQDTTKPTYASSTYLTGNGTIKIVFSETISSAVASKIHIRDTGQSTGGITLSSVTVTVNTLKATLSSAQQTTLNAMTTPQLDIDAGAVQDSSNNAIVAATDKSITIQDTTPPHAQTSEYRDFAKRLVVRFNENLDATINNVSKFHIRDAGSSTVIITLSNEMIIKNGTNYVEFKDDNLHNRFVHIAAPVLDIDSGAVHDTSGNPNAEVTNLSITEYDYSNPQFASSTYYTSNGTLIVSFNEAINKTTRDTSKIHIRDVNESTGGVTLSNSMITANGTSSITFDLNTDNTNKVNKMATPQLDIDAGAVSDMANWPIYAASNKPITVHDTIKPTFSSANYKTGSGEFTITFSETLDSSKHVASKLHIRESNSSTGGVTLSNGTITTNGTNSLTITLSNSDKNSVNALTTPQLDIDAGAVSDSAGNAIAAAADQTITMQDTIKPTFTSAVYKTGSGEFTITFSEQIDSSKHVASKFHIRESNTSSGGVTLSNGTITTNGTNSLTLTLDSTDRATVAGLAAPQLDIDAGAVSDSAGNAIAAAADQTITMQDTIKPTFSSAVYKTGSGEFTVTFSETLDSSKHVASKLHIRESNSSTGGVTLSKRHHHDKRHKLDDHHPVHERQKLGERADRPPAGHRRWRRL